MAIRKRTSLSWESIRRKLGWHTYHRSGKGKRNEEIIVVLHTNDVHGNWSQEEFNSSARTGGGGDAPEEENINSGNLGILSSGEDMAAITIQASFRRHLARRAYRALRSLVKLQALVRGVVVRRQARIALQCMQALARLQITVRARQLHLITPP